MPGSGVGSAGVCLRRVVAKPSRYGETADDRSRPVSTSLKRPLSSATDFRNGSIARGGVGWKLPLGHHHRRKPRTTHAFTKTKPATGAGFD